MKISDVIHSVYEASTFSVESASERGRQIDLALMCLAAGRFDLIREVNACNGVWDPCESPLVVIDDETLAGVRFVLGQGRLDWKSPRIIVKGGRLTDESAAEIREWYAKLQPTAG